MGLHHYAVLFATAKSKENKVLEEWEYIFCYFQIKYELFPSFIFQNIKPILCSTLAKEFVCFYISIIDQMNTLIHVFFCLPQLKPL